MILGHLLFLEQRELETINMFFIACHFQVRMGSQHHLVLRMHILLLQHQVWEKTQVPWYDISRLRQNYFLFREFIRVLGLVCGQFHMMN